MNIEEIKEYYADRLVDGEDGGYPLALHAWLPKIAWLIAEHDRLTGERDRAHTEAAELLHDLHAKVAALEEERDDLKDRVAELTQCDPAWYDASAADAFRLWAEDRKKLAAAEQQAQRMRTALEKIAACNGQDIYGHIAIARAELEGK